MFNLAILTRADRGYQFVIPGNPNEREFSAREYRNFMQLRLLTSTGKKKKRPIARILGEMLHSDLFYL